jgi:hypothetical protein
MWIFAPKTLSIIGDGEGGGHEGKGVSQAGAGTEAATGEDGAPGPVAG